MTPPDLVRAVVSSPALRRYHADRLFLWLYPLLADELPHRIEVRRTASRLKIEPRYVRLALQILVDAGHLRFIGTDNNGQRWYLLRRDGFTPTMDTELAA